MPVNDENDPAGDGGGRATPTTSNDEDVQEAVEASEEDLLTTDPDVRFAGWATLAAFLILTTNYVLWGVLLWTGQARPPYMDAVAYLGVVFALVWTFGKGTTATVSDLSERLPVSFGSSK